MTSSGVAQERHHLDAFLATCSTLPVGSVRPGAPGVEPDFVFEADDAVHPLGIEHTRFYRTDDNGVPVLRIQEGEQGQTIQTVQQLFERTCSEPVHVRLFWSTSVPVTKARRTPLAKAIAERIAAALTASPERSIHLDYDDGLGQGDLAEVDTIFIWRSTPEIGSHWGAPAADYVPDLLPASIQAIIDKKNVKPSNYTAKYQKLWLLIVAEGNGVSSLYNLPAATREHRYRSEFDRVVFFDVFTKEVIDLQIA